MFSWPSRSAISLCLIAAALSAQEQPTFRSGVQNIEVDVFVTDKDGQAVRGLTKDDFTLLEDGQPQPIANVSFVDLPIEPPAARRRALAVVEPDVASNTREGRMYVILLNGSGERARLIARRFVEEAVGPNDEVAVIQPLGNMSAAQGFTRDRQLMLAAIDRIDRAEESSFITDDPIVMSFKVVEDLCHRLGSISGRRKAVLWFDPPSVFHGGGPNPAAQRFAQRDMVRAANRHNVTFYPISTRGLTTELGIGSLLAKAGMRVLADDTGGDSIVDSNNFTGGFERFTRDNSSYYLLAYAPTVDHRDGEFHPIAVRVNRRDVTVRARRGYYAPRPDAEAKPDAPPIEGLSADTAKAMTMPASAGALGLELFAAPFKGTGDTASVVIGARLRGVDLALGAGERIELAYQATTTEGKLSRGAFHAITLDFTPQSRAAIQQNGLGVIDRLELPSGRHQVRFAVHQPNGKTGLVLADVEVPDYSKESLVMSGLVLASTATAADRTLLADERLKAILGSNPTARRRFPTSDTLTAFVEIYTGAQARLEEPMLALLETSRGGVVRVVTPLPMPLEPGRTGFMARIPLAQVRRGDYVLVFETRAGRQAVNRRVPFTVD